MGEGLVLFGTSVSSSLFHWFMFWFLFAELPGVMPEGVVGLTVSQIVASQRAAVRMERNLDLAKDRKLCKQKPKHKPMK